MMARTLKATLFIVMAIGCSDKLESTSTYREGFLHFKFLLDSNGAWKDDGTPSNTTRLLDPIKMESSIEGGTPLYLYCVESSVIESDKPVADTTAVTRGQRITGEAFDPENPIGLTSFGLYAKRNSGTAPDLPIYNFEYKIERRIVEGTNEVDWLDGPNNGWYVEMVNLFGDNEEEWPNGLSVNFYGFAPFPGDGDGEAECISVADTEDGPTITFNMLPEEENNKDILTARKEGINKENEVEGVEMEFQHILSALKFRLDTDDTDVDGNGTNDLKYTDGNTNTVYRLQVKSIQVVGIHDKGTVGIGESAWEVDDTSTGSCTSVLQNRSYNAITNDPDNPRKFINTDEQCMMVLPQTTPEGAKLVITVDLTTDDSEETVVFEDITFEAELDNLTWLPGYTYNYKISKDSRLKTHFIESTNGRTDESFQFEVHGDASTDYPTTFNVTSYAQYSGNPTKVPVKWHIEYTEDEENDPNPTWEVGLPIGFSIKNAQGDYLDYNEIDGSETPVTYTLEASVRKDGNSDIEKLYQNDYSKNAGADGYYDLSIHGIGYNKRTTTTARNTANCYIINGHGKFKLPLVYGNGVKCGIENPIAYKYTWAYNATYDLTESDFTNKLGHGVFCDHNGNQIQKAKIKEQLGRSPSSAVIVWADQQNVIRPSSLLLQQSDNDYLCFEIRQEDVQPANIVLAVKDGNDIAWSWHIWVTAATDFDVTKTLTRNNYSMDVAKYDLGWNTPVVSNISGVKKFRFKVVQNDKMGKEASPHKVDQNGGVVVSDGASIIYQHGRKDPIPNYKVSVSGTPTPDTNGNITINYNGTSLFEKLRILEHLKTIDDVTPKFTIKNPNKIILSRYNWFYETDLNSSYFENQCYLSWNPEADCHSGGGMSNESNYQTHTKTINDPCPVGFMVPNSGLIQMLIDDGRDTNVDGTKVVIDEDGHKATAPYPFITTRSGLTFYTPGGRRLSDNGQYAYLMPHNSNTGYFWTAATYSHGEYGIYFMTSPTAITAGTSGSQRTTSSAFAVRPIRDDQQNSVAQLTDDDVWNFREGDALNIELTPNGNYYGINDLNNIEFTMEENGSTMTLANFINGTGMNDKKVLIRQIKVYFTYNGGTSGGYTRQFTINCEGQSRTQNSTSPDNIRSPWTFQNGWTTKFKESMGAPNTWNFASLVSVSQSTPNRVRFDKVVVDLRICYFD